jgi:hypothetical protein
VQLALLSVENNLLTTFAGVAGCKGLMELYASNNHIGGAGASGSSDGGSGAAVGSGADDSLSSADAAAMASATAAAELLLPNSSLRLVMSLRPEQFPKLIIVDLSGNALTQQHRYREYTIFHLRRLKVRASPHRLLLQCCSPSVTRPYASWLKLVASHCCASPSPGS